MTANSQELLKRLPEEGILHAARVAVLAKYFQVGTDRIDIAEDVAILHDILEDTETDPEEIKFDNVREAVLILTRNPQVAYFDYIQSIIDSKNRAALLVKRADVTDHLLQEATLSASLKSRYKRAIQMLNSAYSIQN